MLSRSIKKEVHLEQILAQDLKSVLADPSQVVQVLLNLGVNANDAITGTGSITYTSIMHQEEKTSDLLNAGEYVCVRVKDTGSGIPQSIINQIFEPFFTTKEIGKGTGLGLSLVHGIMRNHQGAVRVQSEENKGTTFSVYFPVTTNVPTVSNKR